jgi:Fe-S-cluster containining protein
MAHPRLTILNMVAAQEWEPHKNRPRFLQPVEFSRDPCANCVGNCCFAEIRVTTVEALRICLTLSLPFWDVVAASDTPEDPAQQDHRVPIPTSQGAKRLRLRNLEGARCVFLHSVGPRGRCAIHALRPGPCRLFPFSVAVGDRRVSVGSQQMCPVGWLKDATLEQRVARDLAAWDRDIAAEKRLVTAWTRTRQEDRSLQAFLAFAVGRLARRFGKDPQEVLSGGRRTLGKPLW